MSAALPALVPWTSETVALLVQELRAQARVTRETKAEMRELRDAVCILTGAVVELTAELRAGRAREPVPRGEPAAESPTP